MIVPALYAMLTSLLERLSQFVKKGRHVVYTFKSGFSDQNVTVSNTQQPGIIHETHNIRYDQFTLMVNDSLKGDLYQVGKEESGVKA